MFLGKYLGYLPRISIKRGVLREKRLAEREKVNACDRIDENEW